MNVTRGAARAGLAAALAILVGGAVGQSALAQPQPQQQSCTIAEQTAYDVVHYIDTHQPRANYIPSTYFFDAWSDPDQLLGLDGQYISKAGFDDVRVPIGGGIVEMFATRADRAARLISLQRVSRTRFPEAYLAADRVLLRLANGFTVQAQDDYRKILNSMCVSDYQPAPALASFELDSLAP
jgi:hypothetical protein